MALTPLKQERSSEMNPFKINCSRKLFRSRGQAMVELALIFPLLLVFILGAVEFGNMMMTALRTASLSREVTNAGFRDCASLNGAQADTCLENVTSKVFSGAQLLLTKFDSRGSIIATIYKKDPNQPVTLVLQKTKGISHASRYSAGLIDQNIAAKQQRIVIGEVIYQYTPITAIKNFLTLVGFPTEIYEVTIY